MMTEVKEDKKEIIIPDFSFVKLEKEDLENMVKYTYTPNKDITEEELLKFLEEIYKFENNINDTSIFVYLNLRGLNIDLLIEAFRYSMNREDLKNPVMILNIVNLLKIYNSLDDSFFDSDDNYFTVIDDMIDAKLLLSSELQELTKKVSLYFLSVIKSYNKVRFTQLDEYIELPNLFKAMFLTSDFLTISGMFSVSEPFSTDECVIVKDSFKYISSMIMKNNIGLGFMDSFFTTMDENGKMIKDVAEYKEQQELEKANKKDD